MSQPEQPVDPGNPQASPERGSNCSQAAFLEPGTVIDGKYVVIEHIGSGGMGEVYKVSATGSAGLFALKMLSGRLASQKLMAKRLENEARAARTLAHGNIVSVYDVGEATDGAPYLVMDYIEGDSLETLLKKESVFTQERALPLFIQIAEALVHARQKGVLHRDLKPSNILVGKTEGGGELVKIVDFGIAKLSDQDSIDKTRLTQTGELIGTPLYMSPEQCRGEELDGRSDIYSFACIMFEVLSGRAAFAAENQVLVVLKHLSDERPVLPSQTGISSTMKAVINRCLEKDPRDRYDNAVTLQIDLERVLNGKPLQSYKRRFRMKRNSVLAAVASVLLLALAGSVTLLPGMVQKDPVLRSSVVSPLRKQPRPETYKGKNLTQWTNAIEQNPDDPQLYYARAELHAIRDERTNAIDDYSQAISLKPNFLQAYCDRCFQYVMTANYARAEQDANKAVELDPDSPSGFEARGWVFGAREQYAESMAAWSRAVEINDSAYYHYQLALDLLKLGRFDQAQKEISEALEEYPESSTYRAVAGVVAAFKQDFPDALRQLKLATEGSNVRGVELQDLAFYYVCTGNLDEAERVIQQAKAAETFPARAYRLAGELYRTAGKFDKAIQEFNASTSLEEYPPGYRERAIVYIDLGQWRAAHDDLKKSLALNPYSITTLSYLAMVESHLGMKEQSSRDIAAAFKARAIPPVVYVNRATIELQGADLAAALKDADRALSLDPYLKEGYAVRAGIHERLHNAAAAAADRVKADGLVSHLDL